MGTVRLSVLLSLLALFVPTGTASAAPTWVAGPDAPTAPTALDFDALGDAHLIGQPDGIYGFRHYERLSSGGSWLGSESLYDGGDYHAGFWVDQDGDATLLTRDTYTSELSATDRPAGGSWGTLTSLNAFVSDWSRDAASDGSAVVAWRGGSTTGNHAVFARVRTAAGVWGAPITLKEVPTSVPLTEIRAAIALNGTVEVAWIRGQRQSAGEIFVDRATRLPEATDFAVEQVTPNNAYDRHSLSLDMDDAGTSTLAWVQLAAYGQSNAVFYSQRLAGSGDAGDPGALMGANGCGWGSPSVSMSGTGHGVVVADYSCYGGGGALRVVRRPPNGQWSDQETLGHDTQYYSRRQSIHDDGSVFVSWRDDKSYGRIFRPDRPGDGWVAVNPPALNGCIDCVVQGFDPSGTLWYFRENQLERLDDRGPAISAVNVTDPVEASVAAQFSAEAADALGSVASYTWQFTHATADPVNGSGKTFNVVLTEPGEWTATVTVADDAGNTSSASDTFTVVDNPPAVTIGDDHPRWSNDDDPTFAWTVNDISATVTCELVGPEGHPAGTCSASQSYTDLDEGHYEFFVKATDAAGQATERSVLFDIDRSAPSTQITDGPAERIRHRRPEVAFSSSSALAENEPEPSFECRLDSDDDADYEPCESPFDVESDLDDGQHTIDVRAVDAANNAGAPARRSFVVDTAAPETVAEAMTSPTHDRRPSMTFSAAGLAAGETASFRCAIYPSGQAEKADFNACTSPLRPAQDLALGSWEFAAVARDAAGNDDATPATRTVVISAEPAKEPAAQPTPEPTPQPVATAQAVAPGTFTPVAQAISRGVMPSLTPKQQGKAWTVTSLARAKEKLEALGVDVSLSAVGTSAAKAQPRSLRTFLRKDDDAPTAVIATTPVGGSALTSHPGAPQAVTITYFDPAKDDVVEDRLDDEMDDAARRLKRRGKAVPRCDFALLKASSLDEAFLGITPEEARTRLRKADCKAEFKFRRGKVIDPVVTDAKEDRDARTILLTVLMPAQSEFVMTLREDPQARGFDHRDLTFASSTRGEDSDWTLTASDDQKSVFVVQVLERATGRFAGGIPVELYYLGKRVFDGKTNADGEVTVTAKLPSERGSKGDKAALVARYRAGGRTIEGFRDLYVVERTSSFTTPVGREMRYAKGVWTGDADHFKAARDGADGELPLSLVPANLGAGLAGPTARTPATRLAEVQVLLDHQGVTGTAKSQLPAVDLSKGSYLVAADEGVLLASGGRQLQYTGKVVAGAAALRRARAAINFDRNLVKLFFGVIPGGQAVALVMTVQDLAPMLSPATAAKVKSTAAPAVAAKPPKFQPVIDSVFTRNDPPAVSEAARQVGAVNIGGARIGFLNGARMELTLAGGGNVTLAVTKVISTGGGNAVAHLLDGSQIAVSGVAPTAAGTVIAAGGGNVISTGGGNIFSMGGPNVISTGGGNVISTGGGNVISTGGGNVFAAGVPVISVGGANVISTGGGNALPQGVGAVSGASNMFPLGNPVISTGGGNVISTGGGNAVGGGGR